MTALAWGAPAQAQPIPDSPRSFEVAARVGPLLRADLSRRGLRYGAPVFLRVFKRERVLELWLEGRRGRYVKFRDYPICAYSGGLGPKRAQGDLQSPEGYYTVTAAQLNPRSRFHLSFDLGYPNAYDRAHGRDGDFLMVHGGCSSIGCYAMSDAGIEEIYTLVAAALQRGQAQVPVHAFPFRLDAHALEAERASPWYRFWLELKPGYDAFQRAHRPPRVDVDGTRYRVSPR